MIYHMSTKTFMKDFITNVDMDDVLDYQYVIISSGIKADRSKENVTKMTDLFPSNRIASDYLNSGNDEELFMAYYEQLDDINCRVYCAFMIKESIENGDVIILYGPNENKRVPYMKAFEDFMLNEFEYPVYNFKDFLKGECEEIDVDEKMCLKKANRIIEKSKSRALDPHVSTTQQRRKYISELSKKELKKLIRKSGADDLGGSKSDMKDMLYSIYQCQKDDD